MASAIASSEVCGLMHAEFTFHKLPRMRTNAPVGVRLKIVAGPYHEAALPCKGFLHTQTL
eukprot:6128536-Amphidinium_carterae.1